MNDSRVYRWTVWFGLAAGLLLVAAMPLYLVRGTPPSLEDSAKFAEYVTRNNTNFLTGVLVDTVYIACFLVFLAGFVHLIRKVGLAHEWLSTLVFGAGLIACTVALVGDVITAGAALDTFGKVDPAVARALTEAALPAFGAVGLIMMALFLASASCMILITRALPRWTGWVGCLTAILHVVAVPTIYRGNDFMVAMIAGEALPWGSTPTPPRSPGSRS